MHLARALREGSGSLRCGCEGARDVKAECFKTSGSSYLLCLTLLDTVNLGN